MKIIVISDSHGHISNLKHVMGFTGKINIGAIIHCGDWSTTREVETVISYKIPLYSVLGNADIADDIKHKFKDFLKIELGGRKIGIIHNIKKLNFNDLKLDIIFTGHRHSKDDFMINGIRVVRPGAIINGNNFAIYDTDSDRIEFIQDV